MMNEDLRQLMLRIVTHGSIGFDAIEIHSTVGSEYTLDEIVYVLENDKENFRIWNTMNKLRQLKGYRKQYMRIGSVKMMKLKNYYCQRCKMKGVKLWRYPHYADDFRCEKCALKETRKDKRVSDKTRCGNFIGSYIPAVPCLDTDTVWGFSSVPQDCVEWWDNLPETSNEFK